MKPFRSLFLLHIAIGIAAPSLAQVNGLGENVDYVDKTKLELQGRHFAADSLFLGAPFLRDTTKPFVVWLTASPWRGSVLRGNLYLVLADGTEMFLFDNYEAFNTKHDITRQVRGKIGHLDTVYFAYRVPSYNNNIPRYTGPNRSRDDEPPWGSTDRYSSPQQANDNIYPGGPLVGRRWSLAGRITNKGVRTDTVEFSFEDGVDRNYSDNIFHVTGLFLMRPLPEKIVSIVKSGVCPTETVPVTGKVMNTDSTERTEYNSLINWKLEVVGGADGSWVNPAKGAQVSFHPRKAMTTYNIIAWLEDPESPGRILTCTTTVTTALGCYADHIAIEGDSVADPKQMRRKGSIDFAEQENDKSVFAFLRDSADNLVGKADQSAWATRNASYATVAPKAGAGNAWVGNIHRATDSLATTIVTAWDSRVAANKYDSVQVNLKKGYYLKLSLWDKDKNIKLDTVKLNTDQKINLLVKGEPSTAPGTWEDAEVSWQLTPATLKYVGALPASAKEWTYDPTTPGNGQFVHTNSDARTPVLTTPAVVTPGPPCCIKAEIIDTIPPNSPPTAGIPIKVKLTISNTDGIYPGAQWCGSVVFADSLAQGIPRDSTRITYVKSDGTIGVARLGDAIQLCFAYGLDTINATFYAKGIHDLTVTGVTVPKMKDNTGPFNVRPGALCQLQLERPNGTPLDPAESIGYPDGSIVMIAMGYDCFGNRRGAEFSNWAQTGNLDPLKPNANVQRVFISAANVTDDQNGLITASAVSNPAVSDKVDLTIRGAPARLNAPITRDRDGDGYLDAIELHFSKPVDVSADPAYLGKFQIVRGTTSLYPTGIVGLNGSLRDSVAILSLQEDSSARVPQTDWEPFISIAGAAGIGDIAPNTKPCIDGAGPVIWEVVKSITDIADRSKDKVIVEFSENILAADGSTVAVSTKPDSLFNVYYRDLNGTLVPIPGLLSGIGFLDKEPSNDGKYGTRVVFTMSNGNDLLDKYYMNIDSATAHIADDQLPANQPNLVNRKVKVTLMPDVGRVRSFPNPATPEARMSGYPPGYFPVAHDPRVRELVARGGMNGTIITTMIAIPELLPGVTDMVGLIKAYIKIYDVAGNLVHNGENLDLIESIKRDPNNNVSDVVKGKSGYTVDFYWNLYNQDGMQVMPGVYKAFVYIDYDETRAQTGGRKLDLRQVINIGVAR